MRLYGVYSSYEAGDDGAFDITAGVAVSGDPATVQIEAGEYLVFSGQGQMPQLVLFESYGGPDQVDIHIGVVAREHKLV